MYQIDFHKPIRIYFIGIGGISMSGLAEILLAEDFTVSGSDRAPSELTTFLAKTFSPILNFFILKFNISLELGRVTSANLKYMLSSGLQ